MHFLAYCDETISSLQTELQEVSDIKDQRDELIRKIEILRSDINQKATERVKRRERSKEVCFILNKFYTRYEENLHNYIT